MSRRMLGLAVVGLLCAVSGSASALGDGGPGPGVVQGWDGVARGKIRYVAFATGKGTVIEAITKRGGRVLRYAMIDGNYGIPLVANDGTTDGLSHDGRTLVLGDVNSSPTLTKQSTFAVVDVRTLRLRHVIHLRGDFAYDALSPGARMLYLVEHVSAQDITKYQVRAYDLGARRLLPRVVIDKREWESVMQGSPFTRAVTRDGRWVYTLYAGGEHPFVHALDTQTVSAVCMDLPASWNRLDIAGLRLRLQSDGRLLVRHRLGGRPLAVLDTESFRVLSAVRNP
jgi:hypothetical protein